MEIIGTRSRKSVKGKGKLAASSGPDVALRKGFGGSLPIILLRAREGLMRHFRAFLRDYDLTEQQWRVLRALSSVEKFEVTELAGRTFLHGPSLTRILRDLEKRRLVIRRSADDDLRIGLVSISQSGTAIVESISPHFEAISLQMARRYGPAEITKLEKMLIRLEQCFAEGPLIKNDDA